MRAVGCCVGGNGGWWWCCVGGVGGVVLLWRCCCVCVVVWCRSVVGGTPSMVRAVVFACAQNLSRPLCLFVETDQVTDVTTAVVEG